MLIDDYTEKHLDKFINEHIAIEDAESFRNYALAGCETMDDPMEVNWFRLYGNFLSACLEEKRMTP